MTGNFVGPNSNEELANSDSFEEKLIGLILLADDLKRETHRINTLLSNPTTKLVVNSHNSLFGNDGLACAASFLNAATDSLLALRTMTIREVSSERTQVNVSARVNVHGTAGMVRQALECAAKSHWILDASSAKEFDARSLAILWENTTQAQTYLNAIDGPRKVVLGDIKKDLWNEAIKAGMTSEKAQKQMPKVPFLDTSSILRNFHFQKYNFNYLIPNFGNNVNSGEWMYSWLSGIAHGLMWGHLNREAKSDKSKMTAVLVNPDFVRFTLSLAMTVEIIYRIFDKFDRDFPYQKLEQT